MGTSRQGLLTVPESEVFYHTAVIGQSGSGKSYFLARLLEEAVLRTPARVVVLDPNGDFRRFYAAREQDFWQKGQFADQLRELHSRAHGRSYDEYSAFSDEWKEVPFQFVTAGAYSWAPVRPGVRQAPLQVHWKFLESEQDFLLNIDPARYPKVYQGIVSCYHRLKRLGGWYPQGVALEDLEEAAQDFASKRIAMAEYPEAQTLSEEDWLAVRLQFRQLRKRFYRLWHKGRLRDKLRLPTDLSGYVLNGFRDDPWRVCVVGLAASDKDHMLLAANTTLYRLWKSSVQAWKKAQDAVIAQTEAAEAAAAQQPPEDAEKTEAGRPAPEDEAPADEVPAASENATNAARIETDSAADSAFMDDPEAEQDDETEVTADGRVPTIVVIDEAHNFAPEEPENPLQARVSEKIAMIAAEGRKYGLFLCLATQRPKKLRKGLLAECENSALLRIQSELERANAADALNVPRETLAQVAQFEEPGDALMVGRWAVGTPKGKFAPARTVVGGAGIRTDTT